MWAAGHPARRLPVHAQPDIGWHVFAARHRDSEKRARAIDAVCTSGGLDPRTKSSMHRFGCLVDRPAARRHLRLVASKELGFGSTCVEDSLNDPWPTDLSV